MQRLSLIGPLEWPGHRAIEVGDEVQHFGSKILASTQAKRQRSLPANLHLNPPRREHTRLEILGCLIAMASPLLVVLAAWAISALVGVVSAMHPLAALRRLADS